MNQTSFFKNECPACGGGIEFPVIGIAEEIECPHCQNPLLLRFPEGDDDEPVAQIEAFFAGNDLIKTPAQMLFLDRATFAENLKDLRDYEDWKRVLGEEPEAIYRRYLEAGLLLKRHDLLGLVYRLWKDTLKKLAEERGLSIKGTTEQLAKRLCKKDPQGMASIVAGQNYTIHSPRADVLLEKFHKAGKWQENKAKQESLEALKSGDIQAAQRIVFEFEQSRVFARGVNFDLSASDVSDELRHIFSTPLPAQKEHLRIPAALNLIWGEDCDEPLFSGPDEAAEKNALISHAWHLQRIRQMSESGIERVSILTAHLGDECLVCAADDGKKYPIEKCPELPHENCGCRGGCKCIAIAEIDD